jgi:hypothetical protein
MIEFLVGAVIQERIPIPPPMPKRTISQRSALPGTARTMTIGGKEWTLFLPSSWKPQSRQPIAIQFHSAVWHALQEHLDRGATTPILATYPGEGSTTYANLVRDPGVFSELKKQVTEALSKASQSQVSEIGPIDVTSFSAGYGAVREWVQQPEVFARLRRVILADSLYGSLEHGSAMRLPAAEHIRVWLPLAKAAISGEKTFVITVSSVKTPAYASSSEMADGIVKALNGAWKDVQQGSLSATLDREFPLLRRFDSGRLHVWHYGGDDAQAHMTHARHMADIWTALDVFYR